MKIKNILLVEDEPRDADLTLFALAEHNLADRVLVLRDGAEALDYLYCWGKYHARVGGNPVLVMLDNKTPKIGGLEVLTIMKADPRLRSIPVVALTSSREPRDLEAFYEVGGKAYVVKPVVYTEFIRAIRLLGAFRAVINESPPQLPAERALHSDQPREEANAHKSPA